MKKEDKNELKHDVRYLLIGLFVLGSLVAGTCDKSEKNIYDGIKDAANLGIILTTAAAAYRKRD